MQKTEGQTEQNPARAAWNRVGTIVIPDVLSAERFTAIKAETSERLDQALPHVHDHTAAHRDGSLRSTGHHARTTHWPLEIMT
ncbi:hypothetical protein JHN63_24515 [Streptomyces sp. MBT65]|uniref:hypothetical protein n=1 Tax=Streptomyces sp. MBT65 TaxID=1488395 RepID=UPI00190C171D|nr:hypothetical protein [Streptomyces sp. MBT65]MBK3576909.1 hypothetical protein [Streptomyces sp. MBT65]